MKSLYIQLFKDESAKVFHLQKLKEIFLDEEKREANTLVSIKYDAGLSISGL